METEKRYSIGYVSKATGLSTHVIRAWERRYGVIEPRRSESNRRLYAVKDIERLSLLRTAVDAGHSISQVAPLDMSDLRMLGRFPYREAAVERSDSAGEAIAKAVDAVVDLDPAGLESALSAAAVSLPKIKLLSEVIAPLMERIGELWAGGLIRIINEHMASSVVEAFLRELLRQNPPAEGAPRLVTATPSGQWCHLGALMASVVASDGGWNVHYFGPNLPVEEIAAAAVHTRAAAVVLSLTFRSEDEWMARELEKLKRVLPPEVDLIVGGRGVEGRRRQLEAIGLVWLRDLISFSEFIRRAAGAGFDKNRRAAVS